MIYIAVFLTSLFMFFLALQFRDKNKLIFLFFSIIALAIPCLLAGIRDYSIGTDVEVYIEPLFRVSKYFETFKSYITNTGSEVNDILYLLLTFVCGKLSDDIFLLFFMIEFLVIYPVYKTLLLTNEKKGNILIGMFIFFMLFYNLSFNMARQSIAISFALLSFAYCIQKNRKKCILNLIVAILFHSSSVVMIPAYILYTFFEKKEKDASTKFLIKSMIFIFSLVFIVFLPEIVKLLINIGILDNNHFSTIISKFSHFDINYTRTFCYIVFYIVICFNKKRLSNNIKNSDYYIFLSFISILILQFGAVIKYSERIGLYYFYISLFFAMPKLIPQNFNKFTKKELMNLLLILLIFTMYWIYWSILMQSNETYPFIFRQI